MGYASIYWLRVIAAAAAILTVWSGWVSPAGASEGPPPVLHIKTYTSTSGEFSLVVDPSRMHGQGKSKCRLSSRGVEVWSKELDFTFWEAGVADDGVVAGYGYTNGWRGWGDVPGVQGYGETLTVILNHDGVPRMMRSVERGGGQMHGPPDPTAAGCFVDEANDRLVVRYRGTFGQDGHAERWECFRLSTGEPLPEVKLPKPSEDRDRFYMVMDARSIPGTPLALVMMSRMEYGAERKEGVRLSLVDAQCGDVWSQEWPADYAGIEHFSPWILPTREIVQLDKSGFSFGSFAEQSRTSFSIARDATKEGAWTVTAGKPTPAAIVVDRARSVTAAFPTVTLEEVGKIVLGGGDEGAPARQHISEFDIDGKGRFGFLGRGDDKSMTLEILDAGQTPEVRLSIPLPLKQEGKRAYPSAAWVGGERWIVLQGEYDNEAGTIGVWVDVDTKRAQAIEGFTCPMPDMQGGLVGCGDGGFAVMGTYRSDEIIRFDREGKRKWAVTRALLSPQGIAAGPGPRIAVLGVISNEIRIFDDTGQASGTIQLEKSLGKKPNYVADIAPDGANGWILHDFNGKPPVYRLDENGKPKTSFEPRFDDGRLFRLYGSVKRAPDGRLWTCDGTAILRLTDEGVVDRIVGRPPDTEALGEVRAMTVGTDGSIYALDGRNSYVHVFDRAGTPVRIIKPDPTDFGVDAGIGSITVDGEGAVYFRPNSIGLGESRYLKMGADGKRIAFQQSISGEVSDDWVFRPGSKERLVLGYERAFWLNAAGETTRRIERCADRRWLEHVDEGAVARDGSFVIMGSPSAWWQNHSPTMTLFGPDGVPMQTLDTPLDFRFPRVCFNGRTACAVAGALMIMLDINGKASQFTIPGDSQRLSWRPFASPEGDEVWLFEAESFTLRRFKLPAA